MRVPRSLNLRCLPQRLHDWRRQQRATCHWRECVEEYDVLSSMLNHKVCQVNLCVFRCACLLSSVHLPVLHSGQERVHALPAAQRAVPVTQVSVMCQLMQHAQLVIAELTHTQQRMKGHTDNLTCLLFYERWCTHNTLGPNILQLTDVIMRPGTISMPRLPRLSGCAQPFCKNSTYSFHTTLPAPTFHISKGLNFHRTSKVPCSSTPWHAFIDQFVGHIVQRLAMNCLAFLLHNMKLNLPISTNPGSNL